MLMRRMKMRCIDETIEDEERAYMFIYIYVCIYFQDVIDAGMMLPGG